MLGWQTCCAWLPWRLNNQILYGSLGFELLLKNQGVWWWEACISGWFDLGGAGKKVSPPGKGVLWQ